MYKDILQSMTGVEVFPVISLVLFVAVFTVVLIWTSRLDGASLARSAQLPFDDAEVPAAAVALVESPIVHQDLPSLPPARATHAAAHVKGGAS